MVQKSAGKDSLARIAGLQPGTRSAALNHRFGNETSSLPAVRVYRFSGDKTLGCAASSHTEHYENGARDCSRVDR